VTELKEKRRIEVGVPRQAFDLRHFVHGENTAVYSLSRLHFQAREHTLLVEATDGRRIFRMETARLDVGTEDCEFLMSRRMAAAASEMRGDVISVVIEHDRITVSECHRDDAMSCTMQVVDGKYPDIDASLAPRPDNEKTTLRVDLRLLHELIASLTTMTEHYAGGRVFTSIEIPDNGKHPYLFTANADGDPSTVLRLALMPLMPLMPAHHKAVPTSD